MEDNTKVYNVVCPFCDYRMPVRYRAISKSYGVFLRCKNRDCKKEFELILEGGTQAKIALEPLVD